MDFTPAQSAPAARGACYSCESRHLILSASQRPLLFPNRHGLFFSLLLHVLTCHLRRQRRPPGTIVCSLTFNSKLTSARPVTARPRVLLSGKLTLSLPIVLHVMLTVA
jgi:hypothetical protein